MASTSSSSLECSGAGTWNEDDMACTCNDYYVGSDCSLNLYDVIGVKMAVVELFWAAMFLVNLCYGAFLLMRWSQYRSYARIAILSVILASLADLGFRGIIVPDELKGQGCQGYNCNLQDFFYGLVTSFTGCAFVVMIYSWLTISALVSANACMARFGVKILTGIIVGLSFLGTLILLLPLGSNTRLLLSGYFLIYGAFLVGGFLFSGIKVFRLVRKSRDNSTIRFTALLFLESLAAISHIINSLLLVFGDYTHQASLCFYGAALLSNLYRWLMCFFLLLLVTPIKEENSGSDLSISDSVGTKFQLEGAHSDSLFGSMSEEEIEEDLFSESSQSN